MATIQSSTDPRSPEPEMSLRDRLAGIIQGATSYLPESMQSYPDIPQLGVHKGKLADDLMTPAENLPVIGQAVSAEDFVQAAKDKSWLGMGLAGLGMLPGGRIEKNAAETLLDPAVDAGRQALSEISQPARQTWNHGVSGVKLNRPFEEMTSTFKPTSELLPRTEIDPQSLQGKRLVPFVGDRTRTAARSPTSTSSRSASRSTCRAVPTICAARSSRGRTSRCGRRSPAASPP